ncbi:hypothetical protein DFH27DRAFT_606783 [Peziza echinospora]|nr:hypothetical protein DFH27DRAFT_606783 [Peziza echinospora]
MMHPPSQTVKRQMMSFFIPMQPTQGATSASSSAADNASAEQEQLESSIPDQPDQPTIPAWRSVHQSGSRHPILQHRDEEEEEDEIGRGDEHYEQTAPDVPCVKLQRKGSAQVCYIPCLLVQTYENLLQSIQHIFHFPSFIAPEITTFEGDLISNSEQYEQLLSPNLHLIIYFPLDIQPPSGMPTPQMEPVSWITNDDAMPLWQIGNRRNSDFTIDPSQITLTNRPHLPHRHSKILNPRPIHFQPPLLSFYPPHKTPIAVVMNGSMTRDHCLFTVRPRVLVAPGESESYMMNYNPETPSNGGSPSSFFQDFPLGPKAAMTNIEAVAPLWNPAGNSLQPRPEGVFSMTSFDVFAQGKRQRIAVSVNWDAVAHPSGKISFSDSKEKKDVLAWDLGDIAEPASSSRRINWVNYAPSVGRSHDHEHGEADEPNEDTDDYTQFCSTSALERKKCGRFWMLHPPRKLPAAFQPPTQSSNPENIFQFTYSITTKVPEFLTRVYSELGFPGEKVEEIARYWEQVLNSVRDRGMRIILKILSPREISKCFPAEIEPMPDSIVRVFTAMWLIGPDDDTDDLESMVWDDDEEKIKHLVDSTLSHGKGPSGVSLKDFKVFEWGGILLPYGSCASGFTDDRSDSGSDRTIRPSQYQMDSMMEDADERSTPGGSQEEDIDTPMMNDVDAVVLGDDGMYFVMRN